MGCVVDCGLSVLQMVMIVVIVTMRVLVVLHFFYDLVTFY